MVMLIIITGCGGKEDMVKEDYEEVVVVSEFEETEDITNYVKLLVNDEDEIIVKLYESAAPLSVANFQKLVSEKFYDGIIFHRIIEDFVIQGGDPTGTGMGGSTDNVKGEFSSNGYDNPLAHTEGVLSMARSSLPDSASSQFFICLTTDYCASLDGDYAAFGKVIYGMEHVSKYGVVDTDGSDKPLEDIVITNARFVTIK